LVSDDVLDKLDLGQVDLASMFSVITHQNPEEAALTFRMLRRCAQRLYFTAFTDELIDGYTEKFPETPGLTSTYSPGMLQTILKAAGWEIESRHPLIKFQQPAFVCRHSN
jgi:hypothetical protein